MTTKKERDAATKAERTAAAVVAAKKPAPAADDSGGDAPAADADKGTGGNAKAAIVSSRTKARVLVDCHFGLANDVVLETDDVIANHPGELDDHPAAVAYAEANPNPKRARAKPVPQALED